MNALGSAYSTAALHHQHSSNHAFLAPGVEGRHPRALPLQPGLPLERVQLLLLAQPTGGGPVSKHGREGQSWTFLLPEQNTRGGDTYR